MEFFGNPNTDPIGTLEQFLIGNDKGDLYLTTWKESRSPEQYEQDIRRRVKEFLSSR